MRSESDRPLLAILDYGIGNLHSACKGFAHVGADVRLTTDRRLIESADAVVLPGVGAFAPCINALHSSGLADISLERIAAGVPFFGICIGMQVLFASSEEAPGHRGLGVFDDQVRLLADTVKRPQMQWNQLNRCLGDHPMLAGLDDNAWVYFVHSYGVRSVVKANGRCQTGGPWEEPAQVSAGNGVIATCAYGGDIVAAAARGSVWACQFHPEKSGRNGLRILANFVEQARVSSI